MSFKAISYRQLASYLLRHGFREERIPGSHRLFTHDPSDTVIMLPDDVSSRAAWPPQVAAVRRMLDLRGLVPADEFDEEICAGGNGRTKARR
jgi:predicted RNA binding protein YcfA (HicA-like mRNA interferase family)